MLEARARRRVSPHKINFFSPGASGSLKSLPLEYLRSPPNHMLVELMVENYAVVEQARIRFQKGLNVLTGETGSGNIIRFDERKSGDA